tara:strand:+ start:206 stop:910 length:705 start_codon:yes stop_codon:yes gene_type:complete
MISILQYPPDWGFGNRLLYYNNLRQLAEKNADSWSTVPFKGHEHFHSVIQYSRGGNNVLNPCLGEKFFEWHSTSTRNIFKLKDVPLLKRTAAIHFRGGDFHQWNPNSILKTSYYIDSIELCKDSIDRFILFTDDKSLQSYKDVVEYLNKNNMNYTEGVNSSNRSNYIEDFKTMSSCNYIISSPSTYCICAGFIGEDKKIIHSEEWIKSRVKENDKFWVDLHNGGNQDYSIWRLV